jgi:hypothetical protein
VEDELDDDEVLTQYGNRERPPGQPFRNKPRAGKETAISPLRGRLTVDEAARAVNRHRSPREGAHPDDGVRYAKVGDLRRAGVRAALSPTRLIPGHVSATLDGEARWTDDVRTGFDACFTETVWKEVSE